MARALLVTLGGGLVALAACSGSGYQFVENEDLGVYARLPDDWAVYDGSQLEGMGEDPSRWFRGFDASDQPSPAGTVQLGAAEPRGFVTVQLLTPEERDMVNVTSLRARVLGADPLSPQAAEADLPVEALVDEPAEFDGGYHGVHSVFAAAQGEDVAIIDQTAVLDSTSSILYLFVVSCDQDCYFETRSDEIKDIVDSWTIQEARS